MQLIKINNGYLISVNDVYTEEVEIIETGTLEDLKKVVYELILNTTILSTHAAVQKVTNNFIPKNKVALVEINDDEYKILITYGMAFGINTSKKAWTGGLLKIVKFLEDKITT